jgi:hypothetical protein
MQAGGQTGMEGDCIREAVDALDYSAADVRRLIEGKHETTLAHRTKYQPIEDEPASATTRSMRVDVVAQGQARISELNCGGFIDQDIEMRFDEPALDVSVETTVRAFAADFAVLQVNLDYPVAKALGAPFGLSMAFDAHGVHGTLPGECDVAVFPAGSRCPEWSEEEVDLSHPSGFEPHAIFDAVNALNAIPVRWDDGTSTTLSVVLTTEPTWACAEGAPRIRTVCPANMKASVGVRVTTGDKRVDLELPAELDFDVATAASVAYGCGNAPSAGWDGTFSLESSVILPRSALSDGKATLDAPLPDDGEIQVNVGIGRQRDDGVTLAEIEVGAVSLPSDAPAITRPLDLNAMGKPCLSQAEPIARVGMMKPGF